MDILFVLRSHTTRSMQYNHERSEHHRLGGLAVPVTWEYHMWIDVLLSLAHGKQL